MAARSRRATEADGPSRSTGDPSRGTASTGCPSRSTGSISFLYLAPMCTAGADMDGEWILTSELSFGSKKIDEGAQKSECEIKQDGMPECGCKLRPVIRICNEGFDSDRRYISCPYEGLKSCGYLRWIDDACQGRSRMVIQNLAHDNKKLQIALF
ncbi:hypothetical protein ZWY2020_025170 [Hordeum vulgare]|nr:hypothetical protein ZWY2020_025170 [Hordeum vulgare]